MRDSGDFAPQSLAVSLRLIPPLPTGSRAKWLTFASTSSEPCSTDS